MIRKKRDDEQENHERWLISYADFITLMFTFFAALYALSSIDKPKVEKFSGSLRQAFSIIEPPIKLFEERTTMIIDDIRQTIHETPGISVKGDHRGTVITLTDTVAFNSGSAELKEEIKPLLDKILVIIKRHHANNIKIEGHTDNVPISGSIYQSNWELSTARAQSVLRYFTEKGIPPQNLSIAGYGEYRPIADNSTPEGRSKNRRVEIVLLP